MFQLKFILILLLSFCARKELIDRQQALRVVVDQKTIPVWDESLPLDSLKEALGKQMAYFRSDRGEPLQFANRIIPEEDYLLGLEYLHNLLLKGAAKEAIWPHILQNFDFYQVYGRGQWGKVFITSYYEPVIEGRKRPEGPYTMPLYKRPDDLVQIMLSQWKGLEDPPPLIRGRLISGGKGGWPPLKVVPYYSREEIDGENSPLQNKQLEWCFVRPVDAFFLQIQGSGVVTIPGQKPLKLGYAGQNGHPYHSIGKELLDIIPLEKMNLFRIESYLKTLSPREQQALFNKNPSYVFFQKSKDNAITHTGIPATAGRTIATDPRYFPKGALALLAFNRPIFSSLEEVDPVSWDSVAHLVFDQDVGGAIKGGGRVDLFAGRGEQAKRYAGVFRQEGQLFYLAPKKEALVLWKSGKTDDNANN